MPISIGIWVWVLRAFSGGPTSTNSGRRATIGLNKSFAHLTVGCVDTRRSCIAGAFGPFERPCISAASTGPAGAAVTLSSSSILSPWSSVGAVCFRLLQQSDLLE